jgi:hypothetical protein
MGLNRRDIIKRSGALAGIGTAAGGLILLDRARSSDPPGPGDILLRNRDDSRRSVSTTVHWYGSDGTDAGQRLFQQEFTLDPDGRQILEDALEREGRYEVVVRTDAGRSDRMGCVLVWNEDGRRRGMGVRVTIHDGDDTIGTRRMHDGEPVVTAFSDDQHNRDLRETCVPGEATNVR